MSVIFHRLGLSGPHQLIHVGLVGSEDPLFNPLAACYFAPLHSAGDRDRYVLGKTFEFRWIPLAHLVTLPIGSGLYLGARIKVSNLEEGLKVKVRADKGGSRIHRRSDLEREGILRPALDSNGQAKLSETCWYEFVSRDPRFDRVLVPCVTLFFAYYAHTSQLATLLLTGSFESLLRQLEAGLNAVKSCESGHCHLKLDRKRVVAEIPTIARSLFDETGFARKQAIAIGLHRDFYARSGETTHVRAKPPFEGETKLLLNGVTRVSARGERVLIILEILRCSFPFPWTQLETTLDQPGNTADENEGGGGTRKRRRPDALEDEMQEIDGTGAAPGNEFPPTILKDTHGIRFDWLTRETFLIHRREVNRARRKKKPDPESVRNSSQRNQARGDKNSRHVGLSGKAQIGDEDGVDKSRRMTPADAFRYTAEEIAKAAGNLSATFESLLLTPRGLSYLGWKLNCVDQVDGRSRRWTHINSKHPRGILIAELNCAGKHAYVFDIFRRFNESYSILVIHRPDLSQISPADLLETFRRIDEAQRLPKDEHLKRGLGLGIHRVTHLGSKGQHVLSSVLAAVLENSGR